MPKATEEFRVLGIRQLDEPNGDCDNVTVELTVRMGRDVQVDDSPSAKQSLAKALSKPRKLRSGEKVSLRGLRDANYTVIEQDNYGAVALKDLRGGIEVKLRDQLELR